MVPALSTVLVTLATAVWPLQPTPEVVAPFREPEAVWAAGHRGVDLLGWAGQPVHSATDGTVSFAGKVAGRGVVVIAQGTRRTTYEPVDPTVRAGDAVVAGQVVGALTWAGSHCAPRACLHWGLLEGLDDYRDPLSLIACEPRPVRLLPLDREAPAQAPTCAQPSVTWGHRLTSALLRLAGALADRPGATGRS
ncbi:MAG TPA: M23 family metallopeptidase [Nocardioidaceae bacterium]|nr:M23 family metallopeptidase [Nocardioidaceae bacterium]